MWLGTRLGEAHRFAHSLRAVDKWARKEQIRKSPARSRLRVHTARSQQCPGSEERPVSHQSPGCPPADSGGQGEMRPRTGRWWSGFQSQPQAPSVSPGWKIRSREFASSLVAAVLRGEESWQGFESWIRSLTFSPLWISISFL